MTIEERRHYQMQMLKDVFNTWRIKVTSDFEFTVYYLLDEDNIMSVYCTRSEDSLAICLRKNKEICYCKTFNDIDYTIDCAVSYCEGIKNSLTYAI